MREGIILMGEDNSRGRDFKHFHGVVSTATSVQYSTTNDKHPVAVQAELCKLHLINNDTTLRHYTETLH
jgi:hypothetical protein